MNNPYILLTPGPLSTTATVKATMLQDWCTWEDDYKELVQHIRSRLLALASADSAEYTAVLLQGSGTFGIEAVLGTALPPEGKLAIFANGAYGERMEEISRVLKLPSMVFRHEPNRIVAGADVEHALARHPDITHVAFVHCETTTGILNPLEDIVRVVKRHGKTVIVDAMSSFGGIPIAVQELGVDYLVSSANKCIQGVPGFCFVICRTAALAASQGNARSLSLDLHDQWKRMEEGGGKWRYTSPTHAVRAFAQALKELEEEGGVQARHGRYAENHRLLLEGMTAAGFEPYLPIGLQSPVITTFLYPTSYSFSFEHFYYYLRERGFVIYPGKLTDLDVFRIGNIGDVHPPDIRRLVDEVGQYAKGEAQ